MRRDGGRAPEAEHGLIVIRRTTMPVIILLRLVFRMVCRAFSVFLHFVNVFFRKVGE